MFSSAQKIIDFLRECSVLLQEPMDVIVDLQYGLGVPKIRRLTPGGKEQPNRSELVEHFGRGYRTVLQSIPRFRRQCRSVRDIGRNSLSTQVFGNGR